MRLRMVALTALGLGHAGLGQAGIEPVDLLRLSEAFRLSQAVQPSVWAAWETAPFPVVLVTPDREFFTGSPKPPAGFEPVGDSTVIQGGIWSRPRQFDPALLATFPAFGPPAVIVIGRAEVTKKTSTAWVLTVLHEHFHQYQMSDPRYFSATEGLDLSGGDRTGMWMLNYPFPYQSREVVASFEAVSRELARVLSSSSPIDRQRFWQAYTKFLATLSERDRRYLSFQVWQEGVARYVELRVAEVAASAYTPTAEFQKLPDVETFAAAAARLRQEILSELASADLQKQRRVSFYALGASLALLLDQDGADWKARYLTDKFFMEKYAGVTPGPG